MSEYKVGDRVRAKEAIYEPADDYAPGGYFCRKGDLLIVRKLTPQYARSLSLCHTKTSPTTALALSRSKSSHNLRRVRHHDQ